MSIARLTPAVIGILCAPFALILTTPTAQASCAPVTLGVGGSGDPTSSHLPVPAGYTPVPWAAPGIPSDQSQAQGRAALSAAITRARAECPSRSITVVGYSAGAKVAGDVCDTRPAVHCTLIADPRRPGGIEANYPSLLPGYTNAGPRSTKPNETQVCASHDWVCDAPNVFADPVGAVQSAIGVVTGRHQDYYKGPQEPAAPPAPPAPVTPKVVEPIVQAIVPDTPIRDQYVPTPIAAYVPPVLKPVVDLLPPEIRNWTPPPVQLPALPPLPHL